MVVEMKLPILTLIFRNLNELIDFLFNTTKISS